MTDVEIDTNVKDFTNRINFGIIVCTSGTRPNAVNGKPIYETDTDKFLIYDGATWEEISGGGVTDHGALTGLADDDHTQYLLVDGTRSMTGNLVFNKSDPYIYFDTGDCLVYDTVNNSLNIGIGAATEYVFNASGLDMYSNNITRLTSIQAPASTDLTLKVSTGQSIVFQAV